MWRIQPVRSRNSLLRPQLATTARPVRGLWGDLYCIFGVERPSRKNDLYFLLYANSLYIIMLLQQAYWWRSDKTDIVKKSCGYCPMYEHKKKSNIKSLVLLIGLLMLIFRNLLLVLQSIVLESKAFVVLSAFFPFFAVRTVHVQVPAIPVLKTTAIYVYLFFFVFFLSEDDWRLYLFVP